MQFRTELEVEGWFIQTELHRHALSRGDRERGEMRI